MRLEYLLSGADSDILFMATRFIDSTVRYAFTFNLTKDRFYGPYGHRNVYPRASLFNEDREGDKGRKRSGKRRGRPGFARNRANEGNRAIEGSGQRSRGSNAPIKQSRSSVGQSTTLIM